MNSKERTEINEIRQVLDDAMIRADKAFLKSTGANDLAQSIKAMVHVKKRLKKLSEGKV